MKRICYTVDNTFDTNGGYMHGTKANVGLYFLTELPIVLLDTIH